ncbi:MAG: hypothetical protein V1777_02870 [Candidatus Micrarchaeota archaeon]
MASLTYEKPNERKTLLLGIALIILIAFITAGFPLIGQALSKTTQAALSERTACYSQNCAIGLENCLNNSAAIFSACQNRHQTSCFNAQQNADAACEQQFRQCIQNCKNGS